MMKTRLHLCLVGTLIGMVLGGAPWMRAEPVPFEWAHADQFGMRLEAAESGRLTVAGAASNDWGWAMMPDPGYADLEVRGVFSIAQPGTWYDWQYRTYFPMHFCYATEQPGYDFGIVLRYRNRNVFYRVLFSTKWNEVALWKEGEPGVDPEAPPLPTGLFAAVKPVDIKAGRDYAFSVRVAGPRVQVFLDGQQILDYTDPILPLEQGGWGFSVFNGAQVQVSDLALHKAEPEPAPAAAKHPRFTARKWRGDDVIFDGDEPIARLAHGTAFWFVDAKLKPGYRPLMSWPHLFANAFRSSRMQSLTCPDETSVLCTFGVSNQVISGHGTTSVEFDAERDAYTYTIDKAVTFQQAANANAYFYYKGVYFANTYYYNSMPTTDDSVPIDWDRLYTASSPYRFALVKGADGTPYRFSIHHVYPGWLKAGSSIQDWALAPDAYFMRYPEPIICPVFEVVSLGALGGRQETPMLTPCCSYWDMHYSYVPHKDGEPVTAFKGGDVYRDRFRITGFPRAEADRLVAQSQLAPFLDPDQECPWYTSGVNTFARGGNVEQTAGREIWACKKGVTWDKTVGRTDTFSLRFENDARINDNLFVYNDDGVKTEQWELTAWVKTEAWEGPGLRLGIRNLFTKTEDMSDLILLEPGGWQKVSYVGQNPSDSLVYIEIQTRGKGICWVDDVEFRKLDSEKK